MGNEIIETGRNLILLPSTTITTAVAGTTGTSFTGFDGSSAVIFQANFTYGSGGTNAKFWVQTSFDRGATWCDVMNFAFLTASLNKVGAAIGAGVTPVTVTDATLADNTVNAGFLGDRFRIKYTTTGTYAGGTTILVTGLVKAS